jgi:hypothetical protein
MKRPTGSREDTIARFLAQHGHVTMRMTPLAQDASYRRYWRLDEGGQSAVLMDAPPPEDLSAFVRVAMHLAGLGLSVPVIRAIDLEAGLLLEEDLGDGIFSRIMTAANAVELFDAAVDVLVIIHRAPPPADLPAWGADEMTETALGTLFDWWWPASFGAPAPESARADVRAALRDILAPLRAGPSGFVHRDYFAGNLVWLPERAGPRRVGVLDFQSAAIGHPAYDVVSLVEDARRDIPAEIRAHVIARYLAARPELEAAAFRAACAVCAAQRHLRVAGQWVRLARRDDRPHYLAHGARTWGLLDNALRAPEVAPLARALDRWIPRERRGNPPDLPAGTP